MASPENKMTKIQMRLICSWMTIYEIDWNNRSVDTKNMSLKLWLTTKNTTNTSYFLSNTEDTRGAILSHAELLVEYNKFEVSVQTPSPSPDQLKYPSLQQHHHSAFKMYPSRGQTIEYRNPDELPVLYAVPAPRYIMLRKYKRINKNSIAPVSNTVPHYLRVYFIFMIRESGKLNVK